MCSRSGKTSSCPSPQPPPPKRGEGEPVARPANSHRRIYLPVSAVFPLPARWEREQGEGPVGAQRKRGYDMKVGFIGLGTMGASMAANLQKAGHELGVHDIRRAAAERHLAAGAVWADTPKALAAQSEGHFTSMPGPPEVEQVALGPNGLLAGMKDGSAYLDLSTNSPTLVRELNRRFSEKHVYMLDAPVSGGPRGAASGRLALWVGGDEQIFNRHKKVLDAIGDQARYIGPIGAGSVAKLVHNCAGYAVQCVMAEVFTMGVKAGVEPLALWEAAHLRRAWRSLPAQQIRSARFRVAPRAQGRDVGDPARARIEGADAPGQSR